jgi:hypothetical protein
MGRITTDQGDAMACPYPKKAEAGLRPASATIFIK